MRKHKFVSNKKFGIYSIVFALVVTGGGVTYYNHLFNNKNIKINNYTYMQKVNMIDNLIEQAEQTKMIKTIVTETKQKPKYNISLSKEYQDLIYRLCEQNHLSYELVLAVMYQESKFDVDKTNTNTDHSVDRGLFQINSKHLKDYEEYAKLYGGLPNNMKLNVSNPEHNIRAGIGGLTYFMTYYKEKGMSDDGLIYATLGGYNQGAGGFNKYVNRNNYIETQYAKKVLYYKYMLEQEGYLE